MLGSFGYPTTSSIAIAGCGLICVGAGEEWARKALRGLRGVESQVVLTRGTWWPHGGKKSNTKSSIGAGAG
jgi:hypothetical protein